MEVFVINPSKGFELENTKELVSIEKLSDGRFAVGWSGDHPNKQLLRDNVWRKKYGITDVVDNMFHPFVIEECSLSKIKRLLNKLGCEYEIL